MSRITPLIHSTDLLSHGQRCAHGIGESIGGGNRQLPGHRPAYRRSGASCIVGASCTSQVLIQALLLQVCLAGTIITIFCNMIMMLVWGGEAAELLPRRKEMGEPQVREARPEIIV